MPGIPRVGDDRPLAARLNQFAIGVIGHGRLIPRGDLIGGIVRPCGLRWWKARASPGASHGRAVAGSVILVGEGAQGRRALGVREFF